MEKEFVPYEEALALKELGFDEKCLGYYKALGNELIIVTKINLNINSREIWEEGCTAPLYQQAFRWFREKYKLTSTFTSVVKDSFLIDILDISSTTDNGVYNGKKWDCDDVEDVVKTYEEAELASIKKLIEIVKRIDK